MRSILTTFTPTGTTFIRLTCAIDSISIKASMTGALKATKGVIAGSIRVAVVYLSHTLINIYKKQRIVHNVIYHTNLEYTLTYVILISHIPDQYNSWHITRVVIITVKAFFKPMLTAHQCM